MKKLLLTLILSTGIYSNAGVVTDINLETDTVTATDFNGHEWQFTDVSDWEIGDGISMVMYSNGTKGIEDDIILRTRYHRLEIEETPYGILYTFGDGTGYFQETK